MQVIDSAKIIEYRFGYNFGQIFRDFSNNGRHAVNGISHLTATDDIMETDRGAYFDGNQQTVQMPINSYVPTDIRFTSPFTVITWVLSQDKDGHIFTRFKSTSDYLTIKREDGGDKLVFDASLAGQNTGIIKGVTGTFLKGKS